MRIKYIEYIFLICCNLCCCSQNSNYGKYKEKIIEGFDLKMNQIDEALYGKEKFTMYEYNYVFSYQDGLDCVFYCAYLHHSFSNDYIETAKVFFSFEPDTLSLTDSSPIEYSNISYELKCENYKGFGGFEKIK